MRLFRLLPFLGGLFVGGGLPAQQMPYFNQHQWVPRLFNPAAQGADGQGMLAAAYRLQFQQLPAEARPNTYLLHADLSGLMPERIGVGVQASTDLAHLLRQTQVTGFFAYQLINAEHWRLALGVGAGVRSYQFNLNANRLGNAVDVGLFQGTVNRLRFDGGPGLFAERRWRSGSTLAVDAAAAQLFTSELNLAQDGSDQLGYRTAPHVLINTRYRHQLHALAIEPALMVRAGGSVKRAFDLNLNAYFLPEDRLMAGIGLRSHGGGARFVLGLAPWSVLRLTACAEFHRALGATYEFGASVALARRTYLPRIEESPLSPAPVNLLRGEQEAVSALRQAFELSAGLLRQRQADLSALLSLAESDPTPQRQAMTADTCVLLLAQSEAELQQMRQALRALALLEQQAQNTVRTVSEGGGSISPETRAALRDIERQVAEINSQTEASAATHQRLTEHCAAIRPQRKENDCVRLGDGECVQALFMQALRQAPGLPPSLLPLRTFVFPGAAAVTYHFADDEEDYVLGSTKIALAQHIVQQIRRMQEQGLVLDNITLVTELQEDRSTLTYEPGVTYDGFLGDSPLVYSLVDNETAAVMTQTRTLPADASLNLETLAALKIAAWRSFLLAQGIPAGRVLLQVRYNHADNNYRQETKVVVKFRS